MGYYNFLEDNVERFLMGTFILQHVYIKREHGITYKHNYKKLMITRNIDIVRFISASNINTCSYSI